MPLCKECGLTRWLYNPGVVSIVEQVPYVPNFVDLIPRFDGKTQLKFQHAVQKRKKTSGKLDADFDTTSTTFTFPLECRCRVTKCTILSIGTVQYHITAYDCATGVATLSVLPGQTVPALIPAGTIWSAATNVQALCGTYQGKSRFEADKFDFALQRYTTSINICKETDDISKAWGMDTTFNEKEDDLNTMYNDHLQGLDEISFFSIPSDLGNGKCTTAGYKYLVDTYGYNYIVADPTDPLQLGTLTAAEWKKFGLSLKNEQINGKVIIGNQNTICCIQEALKQLCTGQCNVQAWSDQNVIGFDYGAIHLPGRGNMAFRYFDDTRLPDGVAYIFDQNNVVGLTRQDSNGNNVLAKYFDTVKGQDEDWNILAGVECEIHHSYVGILAKHPELTAKITFKCP